jgi:hypothetical protein
LKRKLLVASRGFAGGARDLIGSTADRPRRLTRGAHRFGDAPRKFSIFRVVMEGSITDIGVEGK